MTPSGTQLPLVFRTWGGARRKAGRPKTGRAGVPHRSRQPLTRCSPVHVTVRLRRTFWHLRTRATALVLRAAFQGGCDRTGFRLVHFSVQTAHLHLIVEAETARALGLGVRGLLVRIARGLNRLLRRKGNVFPDRYHAHVLTAPREARRVLVYVLQNARHHPATGAPASGPWADEYSSARYFDGWRSPPPLGGPAPPGPAPVVPARTWLLTHGWNLDGNLICPTERPAGARDGLSPPPARPAP